MADKNFKIKSGLQVPGVTSAPFVTTDSSGTVSAGTTLPIANGGTGQTSANNALNALLPVQNGSTVNYALESDGTNTSWQKLYNQTIKNNGTTVTPRGTLNIVNGTFSDDLANDTTILTLAKGYTVGNTASRPGSPAVGDLYFNSELNYFESYTTNGWFPIAAAPLAPTGVSATNQPSGRAYNNGQMSVAFTPNTSGGAPTSFIVTPSPTTSPSTFTASSSPITVTGLSSSTQYTYTVVSTSPYGTSSASSASSAVTATTVPQAPSLAAVGAAASANITITPGATGGSAITQYTITSNPATTTQTTSNTSYTFTGLTDGTAYTFTATATNANGTSAASAASNSVTPQSWTPEGAYDALATVTVPSGGLSSVTFAGIPTGYKHLQIRAMMLGSTTGVDAPYIRYNGDTGNNYTFHALLGEGAQARAQAVTSTSSTNIGAFWFGLLGSYPSVSIIDVLDYANTSKYKTTRCLVGQDNNATYGSVGLGSGVWMNTNAINSLTIFNSGSTTFSQYSSFALYGVK